MTFTNVWDTTAPSDAQVANLYGQNLRGMRLDFQQRHAALSGLDASKPPFNTDAQPANWNGRLFFPTDSNRVYQWNNPNWTDVSTSFRDVAYVARTIVTVSGTTGNRTIYTLTIPAGVINASTRMRVTVTGNVAAGVNTSSATTIAFGGQTITGNVSFSGGIWFMYIEGGNFGSASAQSWTMYELLPIGGVLNAAGISFQTTTVNTTLQQSFTLSWNPQSTGDSFAFYGMLVELF